MDSEETTSGRPSEDRGRSRKKKKKKRGASNWLPSSLRKLRGFVLGVTSARVDDGEPRPRRSAGRDPPSPSSSCFPWLQKGRRRQGEEEEGGGGKDAAQVKGSEADDGERATEVAAAVAAERRAMTAEMISSVVVEAVKPNFLQKLFSKDYRVNSDQRGFNAQKRGTVRPKDNCNSAVPISTSTVNPCLKPNPLVNEPKPNPQRVGNRIDSENQPQQPFSLLPNQKQTESTAAAPFGFTMNNVRSTEQESRADSTTQSSLSGLLVVMTMMWMLLLGGRLVAVIFTCFLFYLLPLIRPLTPTKGENIVGNKPTIEVEYDSKEYKKKVLMEGLLDRNGRRPKPTVRFS